MRKIIRQFVSIVAETLPTPAPIYEFGSCQTPGQESIADLRPLFPGKEYVGCDMREGRGVDRILNLHSIDLPSGSAGTVLALDTMEHVEYPWKAIAESYRILRPGGLLVISSHMNFPIHSYPSDYWRFTPEAFKSLLKVFPAQFVDFAGQSDFPHTVIGIGFNGPVPQPGMDEFVRRFQEWQRKSRELSMSAKIVTTVKLFSPPGLLNLYYKSRGSRSKPDAASK